MIEFYLRTVRDEKLQKIEEFREGCWINVESPSEEEMEKISKDFKIDIDWLKSSMDLDEKSRIEEGADNNENTLQG
jgi:magnesium transporter